MGNFKIAKILFFVITILLLGYFIISPTVDPAGDAVEYYGTTQSLINHQSLNFSYKDQNSLSGQFNPSQFADNQYFINGKDGLNYPVHFPFYSILLTPVRIITQALGMNGLKSFAILNTIILSLVAWIAIKFLIKKESKKSTFLILFYLSPLLSFIIWPGPDIFYIGLITLSIFLFFDKKYSLSALSAAIASWQSSPLAAIALGIICWDIFSKIRVELDPDKNRYIWFYPKNLLNIVPAIIALLVPYLYNYIIFGVFSPWQILTDPLTQYYGFGLQNASIQKLFEMLFDLNIGLFFYATLIVISGIYLVIKKIIQKDKKAIFFLIITLVSAILFQTNPSWHNGTAGFGPGRYELIFLPLFIFLIIENLPSNKNLLMFSISLIVITQFIVLSSNGFIRPNFDKVHYHSYIASFVLDHSPGLYNPTPQIFIDRTNHNDIKTPKSAVYKVDGQCKKAYILKTDKDYLIKECGFIPENYIKNFDDDLSRKASYARKTKVISATFWSDDYACKKGLTWKDSYPFICMREKYEVVQQAGVKDESRIKKIPEFPGEGIWRVTEGKPIEITVPPGYFINYASYEGFYVNY